MTEQSEPDPWWYRASPRAVLVASFAVAMLTVGLVLLVNPDPSPWAIFWITLGMMMFAPLVRGILYQLHDDRMGRPGKRKETP